MADLYALTEADVLALRSLLARNKDHAYAIDADVAQRLAKTAAVYVVQVAVPAATESEIEERLKDGTRRMVTRTIPGRANADVYRITEEIGANDKPTGQQYATRALAGSTADDIDARPSVKQTVYNFSSTEIELGFHLAIRDAYGYLLLVTSSGGGGSDCCSTTMPPNTPIHRYETTLPNEGASLDKDGKSEPVVLDDNEQYRWRLDTGANPATITLDALGAENYEATYAALNGKFWDRGSQNFALLHNDNLPDDIPTVICVAPKPGP